MALEFRFGIQVASLPGSGWKKRVKKIEALGYSTVCFEDHFETQWDPAAALSAIAAVTDSLHVGSLVYGVDYRHPAVLAKAAATVQVLSGGRHEFGLGAGWMREDYEQLGMTYDAPAVRISRLEEALKLIRMLWTRDQTSFEGKHFVIRNMPRTVDLEGIAEPKILVGGGGKRLLSVAGRHADIVGINPSLPEGRVTPDTLADVSPTRLKKKVSWVRQAAEASGRDPASIELSSLAFAIGIGPTASVVRSALAKQTGMSLDDISASPMFLTGSPSEIRDRLCERREATGISYIVIRDGDHVDAFAEHILAPLVGT